MSKEITARDANKLKLELQQVLVKCLEVALQHTFNGKSMLWGKEVENSDLQRAKNTLTELDRKQAIYDSGKFEALPYFNSNSSIVEKTKSHLSDSGIVKFVEAKDNARVDSVKRHLNSKQVIRKQIRKSILNNKPSPSEVEANKMATKKANSKKANSKKASSKKVYKGTVTAQDMRDAYDKNPKSFNVAEYATKNDVAYGRVYGAIVKHVGGVDKVGKPAPKAKVAPAKKAAAKKPAKKAAAATA